MLFMSVKLNQKHIFEKCQLGVEMKICREFVPIQCREFVGIPSFSSSRVKVIPIV